MFTIFYFKNDNFTRIKIIQYSKLFKTSNNILEVTKIFLEDEKIALSNEKVNSRERIFIKKVNYPKTGFLLQISLVGKGGEMVSSMLLNLINKKFLLNMIFQIEALYFL